ncbi:MAG: ABC transporter permease [Anaerolineales bacterium]|nr:ABC transporter permease [Anaerolineales bacterium]
MPDPRGWKSETVMRRYVVLRLGQIVLTYFLFLVLIYFLLEALPGNFLGALFGESRLTAGQLDALGAQLGLQGSAAERFLQWMGGFLRGDLGISLSQYPRPVMEILAERAPRTLALFLAATLLSFSFGFFAGKILAMRRGTAFETTVTVGGITLYTVFTPWFALWLLWIFAYALRLFPVGKFITYEMWEAGAPDANAVFRHLLLGGLMLAMVAWAVFRRTARLIPARKRAVRTASIAAALLVFCGYWIVTGQAAYVLDILYHMALPVLTLTLISFGGTMLLTRSSMLETMREDYVLLARAKGLPESEIRDRHIARGALLPVVTTLVFSLAFAIGGGVITESIFSWEGMGYTLMEAVTLSDIPLAVGAMAFTGLLVLAAHLAADLLYAFLDPRIRYG